MKLAFTLPTRSLFWVVLLALLASCVRNESSQVYAITEVQKPLVSQLANQILYANLKTIDLQILAKNFERVIKQGEMEVVTAVVKDTKLLDNEVSKTVSHPNLYDLHDVFRYCLLNFENTEPETLKSLSGISALIHPTTFKLIEAFQFYHADNETRLIAFYFYTDKARYYVAFNFSWEIHQVPLPYGFMASTKVSIWESDIRTVNTFVTQQALVIRPYTAIVIRV